MRKVIWWRSCYTDYCFSIMNGQIAENEHNNFLLNKTSAIAFTLTIFMVIKKRLWFF
jgi:hypothetical protein